jgi:PA14 domain
VLGPPGAGRWRLVAKRGVRALSHDSGRVPDTTLVTLDPDSTGDWGLTLEYVGAATLSPSGVMARAGKPYTFSYERFEPPIRWSVQFFRWKDSAKTFDTPVDTAVKTLPRLDVLRYDRPGNDHWSLRASGAVTLAPGSYTLRAISDDAIRVYVDDKLAIDDWTPHESKVDTAALAAGNHQLRVEYAQVDGWVELRVEIVRGTP